jgi:hypothetical protein
MATVTPSSNPRTANPPDHIKTTPSTTERPCSMDILNGGEQQFASAGRMLLFAALGWCLASLDRRPH